MNKLDTLYQKMINDIILEFEKALVEGKYDIAKLKKMVLEKLIKEYNELKKETDSYNYLRDAYIIQKTSEIKKASKYLETAKEKYSTANSEDKKKILSKTDNKEIEKIHKFFEQKQANVINGSLRQIRKFFDNAQKTATHKLNELVSKKTIKTIAGENRIKAIESLTEELKDALKVPLVNKNKKVIKMELAAYTKLNVNTALQNANNSSTINTGKELGNHLVIFSSHGWTCIVCAKYAEGRVYSTDPSDKTWPYLYDLPGFKEGYNNLHPNCKHRISGYYLIAYSEQEVANKRKLSYNSTDIRSEQNITKYNEAQRKMRIKRLNRLKKQTSMIKNNSK